MTRRDVTFAAIMSAVALAVYVGVKVWLGGHWDWVTFVIWVLAALLFGFGIIYAKSFLMFKFSCFQCGDKLIIIIACHNRTNQCTNSSSNNRNWNQCLSDSHRISCCCKV